MEVMDVDSVNIANCTSCSYNICDRFTVFVIIHATLFLSLGISQPDEEQQQVESKNFSDITQTSNITFRAIQAGFVRCKARNRLGSDSADAKVKLGDLPQPFLISGLDEDQKIAQGDLVKLKCAAIIYNYSSEIAWTRDGEVVVGNDNVKVEENHTTFSWRKTLTWRAISKEDDGIYQCEVFNRSDTDTSETKQVAIKVLDAEAPMITANFNQSRMVQVVGQSLRLDCLVSGLPTPNLLWYKDDEIFTPSESSSNETTMQRVMIENNNQTLDFKVLTPEDNGKYKCVAMNRIASDFKELELEIPSEF